MTDATRTDRTQVLEGGAGPPSPTVGPPSEMRSGPRGEPPGLGRSIVVASAVAITVVLSTVTIGLLATGTSPASSFGIAAFAALWGGGGFGAMIGGVLYAHRLEQGDPTPSSVGSDHDLAPALLPAWPSTTTVPAMRAKRAASS